MIVGNETDIQGQETQPDTKTLKRAREKQLVTYKELPEGYQLISAEILQIRME